MRSLTALLAFLLATLAVGTSFAQGDTPKGLFLTTDYPSQTCLLYTSPSPRD